METRKVEDVDRDSTNANVKTLQELVAFVTIGGYYKKKSSSFSLKLTAILAYLCMQRS